MRKKKKAMDYHIKLRFTAKGINFLTTGTSNKNGVWVHDIKNLENGKRVYNLTDEKIMKDMSPEEKENYLKRYEI
jgi:hypothetical protein